MPSLKDYRDRIQSVKSTRKITSAMKMVAAAKLKKAQQAAEEGQPYARAMEAMMLRVAAGVNINASSPKLLVGTGKEETHLLVVLTSDRGLCGGFNSNLMRWTREYVKDLLQDGKRVKILCVGRKGRDNLKKDVAAQLVIGAFTDVSSKEGVSYAKLEDVGRKILDLFDAGEFDVCTLMYNRFKNVLIQQPVKQQLIPLSLPEDTPLAEEETQHAENKPAPDQVYDFEPEEEKLLAQLLPKNLKAQLFQAMLDNAAGEQAARMTAMDNATGAAGDMINDLTLQYNRERQAVITKELIEIISGSEAA